ncbi:MAG: hypothetical protein ACLP3R_24025, partial [Candidatus Korobacteraceae bacterium]
KLKDQVQFCPVTSDMAIYQERYAPNIAGLPTVRMQQPDAVVVYEAAGKDIPMTAEGLNGALAGAVSKAQGLFPILPWRRNADNRLNNLERRKPQPQPQPNTDPKPQPIDDGGKPEVAPPDVLVLITSAAEAGSDIPTVHARLKACSTLFAFQEDEQSSLER